MRLVPALYTRAVSASHATEFVKPSRTKQSFKGEANINNIMKQYGVTGHLPMKVRTPLTGDFDGITNYQDCLNAMRLADESFMELPAEVRKRFGNDPHAFVNWCSETNAKGEFVHAEEMREIGLAVPKTAPVPEKVQKVEVVNKPPEAKPKDS